MNPPPTALPVETALRGSVAVVGVSRNADLDIGHRAAAYTESGARPLSIQRLRIRPAGGRGSGRSA